MRNKVLALLVVGGVLATIFNIAYLIFMLISYSTWTDGAYHHPVLTVLFGWGAVVCVAGLALGITALFRSGPEWRLKLAVIAFCAVGAAAGIWLPFIHVSEADVTGTGFQQSRFAVPVTYSLRLYNISDAPVRICVGAHGRCADDGTGPQQLRGAGLLLNPGETISVRADTVGTFPITIAEPPAGMTAIDITVEVYPPAEDNGVPY